LKPPTLKEYFTAWVIRGTAWAAAAVCMLGMAASGCGDREVPSTATTKEKQASPTQAEPAGAADAKEIRTVTAKQIRALVDDSKGKVVVVNFWASWCPPCVREFPAIIKVYEQYHDKGLEMFAISLNSPEEMADVEQFLQTHKPPFRIYRADTQDETFAQSVLKDWSGEMPMTLVFNTAGERVLAHRSEVTYEELSSKVKPLLPPQ
jgi:thiol-disulfide isomerase/thioredoxin